MIKVTWPLGAGSNASAFPAHHDANTTSAHADRHLASFVIVGFLAFMNVFLNFFYRPVKYAPAAAGRAFRAPYARLKFGLAVAYMMFYKANSPRVIGKRDTKTKPDIDPARIAVYRFAASSAGGGVSKSEGICRSPAREWVRSSATRQADGRPMAW